MLFLYFYYFIAFTVVHLNVIYLQYLSPRFVANKKKANCNLLKTCIEICKYVINFTACMYLYIQVCASHHHFTIILFLRERAPAGAWGRDRGRRAGSHDPEIVT